ncbi:hypothetical protein D3C73_1355350 [compost metagenome]
MAVRMLFQPEIDFVAVIIAGRKKEIMPPNGILGELHQRLAVVAVQAVAQFKPDAAERRPHMDGGDMLIWIIGIKADKIPDLLALHVNDIERLSFAHQGAPALIGRYEYFLN